MQHSKLYNEVREALSSTNWDLAIRLARTSTVRLVSNDGEEVLARVRTKGRVGWSEVYLWPDDPDWGCDCEEGDGCCVHVAVVMLALRESDQSIEQTPPPREIFQVDVAYEFVSAGPQLSVRRFAVRANGSRELVEGTLEQLHMVSSSAHLSIERVIAPIGVVDLSSTQLRAVLAQVNDQMEATLDGEKVVLSSIPVEFFLRVSDAPDGFKIGLYRPKKVKHLFSGAAFLNGELRPTSAGKLTKEEQGRYLSGVVVMRRHVGRLVTEVLPELRGKITVKITSTKLPKVAELQPSVRLTLNSAPSGLQVKAELVYGDPPVASISGFDMRQFGDVVVVRDRGAERLVIRDFERRTGIAVGRMQTLDPVRAATLLESNLGGFKGKVLGRVDSSRYRIDDNPIEPSLFVEAVDGESGRFRFDASFAHGAETLPMASVVRAWSSGAGVIALPKGGFAPIPLDWMSTHASMVVDLLESRDPTGTIDMSATAALVDLLDDVVGEAPAELKRIRGWLESGDDLEKTPLPPGFLATLRNYQEIGRRWLGFLRGVGLHGILADDMGLGKTVQALAALAEIGGPSLVVAPTSVIQGWRSEAKRFAPNLKVNLYHGPKRALDGDADLTITSYALLRLDREKLGVTRWRYLILDEAQAIKNPDSQTARAAFQLGADYRLALTGTPIENRLEELWSLFRFLSPGLLGTRKGFKENFIDPIQCGDHQVSDRLRRRVRPYILRRMKSEVATELPSLTDVVIRCEMAPDQRKVYDAVRFSGRSAVLHALGVSGKIKPMAVLEALLRLRQACCDPSLLPGAVGSGVSSAKLDRLEEMLVDILVDDHKALIFSQWTGLLDRVEVRLKELGVEWLRLDGSTRNRAKVVDRFQSPDGPSLFLISLKAGGTGLNLTAADYVFHLDPWWNPAVQQQATDRAHRIGQNKPVVSVRFIASETVEERVLQMQEQKRGLADSVLSGAGGFVNSLSADELRALFDDME